MKITNEQHRLRIEKRRASYVALRPHFQRRRYRIAPNISRNHPHAGKSIAEHAAIKLDVTGRAY